MTKLPSTTIKSIEVDGETVSRGNIAHDPLKIKIRLYIQISEMLRQLEQGEGDDGAITIRERIAALSAIGRLQMVIIDKGKDDDDTAGSAVRKYENAFKNGAGRRKKASRAGADKLAESDREWSRGFDDDTDSDTSP